MGGGQGAEVRGRARRAILPCPWLLTAAVALAGVGCGQEVCAGEEGCVLPSPCARLAFECAGGTVSVEVATAATELPTGLAALGSPGDFVLRSDRVVAVIDALDHPHHVAPTGGTLIDLAPASSGVDGLDSVFQATGLLPGDAVRYTSARILEGEGFAAVQVRGHLDGHPDQPVVTRYELRPCEPGLRIRTEAVNLEPDPAVWTLTDGWYWGGRSNLPFVPHRGVGFEYPSIELTALTDSFRPIPYLATLPAPGSPTTYGCVPCSRERLHGFHSEDVSSAGNEPRIVPPRDYQVLERFVVVAEGSSVAPAVDLALEARRQLFGEAWATVRGILETEDPLGDEARATIHLERGRAGDPAADRTPLSQITPGPGGAFEARVPRGSELVAIVEAFGRRGAPLAVGRVAGDVDLGSIPLAPGGRLTLEATVDGVEDQVLALVHPADDATRARVEAHRPGEPGECAPYLGVTHGGSPACNRVLVDGPTTVVAPPGRYHVYATAGLFATIAREEVLVEAGGEATVALALETLDLVPPGALSADFHVHGGRSFDSAVPDHDRVRAFLAARVDVIAATDHDVVHGYGEALMDLGAGGRLIVVPGVETTGHILFDLVPGAAFPQVIGHWNFWPLAEDAQGPWRGAPWDELVEPGALFDRVEAAGWPAASGVIQLNHPWDEPDFGRDLGFPRAIGLDATRPLPATWDGTAQGLFVRVPPGATYANHDYHAQEVMNGSRNGMHLAYRALWFYLLSHGVVRAGTANSDSHGLTDNVLGSPRTLVWSEVTRDRFVQATFDAAVRAGRMVGTNGPVLEVSTTGADGATRGPSTVPFEPAPDAALRLRVTAAPWVPVSEVRIVVNGEVVRTLSDELAHPADPFGAGGTVRWEGELSLAELLPGAAGDAWLVVEAGHPLMPAADLDCDGIPDTGDNDGDGVIDARDVDVRATDGTPHRPGATGGGRCLGDVGPLRDPPVPLDRDAPGYHFAAVVPRGQPAAFSNPLLLDLDGGGWAGVTP